MTFRITSTEAIDTHDDARDRAASKLAEYIEDNALRAENGLAGWSVIDPTAGVWWPADDAAAEIEASDDPSATAIRICTESPMRGAWHQ